MDKFILNGRYSVSKEGKIYSHWFRNGKTNRKRNVAKELKQSEGVSGYMRVRLAGQRTKLVHRIVAEFWLEGFTENDIINHIDGNPRNNHIDNLEISNFAHNLEHARNTLCKRRYEKLNETKVEEIINLFAEGVNRYHIAEKYKVNPKAIHNLLNIRFRDRDTKYGKIYRQRILIGFSKCVKSKFKNEAIRLLEELDE